MTESRLASWYPAEFGVDPLADKLEGYWPESAKDLKFIEDIFLPLEDSKFLNRAEPEFVFHAVSNGMGDLVIANVLHRDYRYAFCQVQIKFGKEGKNEMYCIQKGAEEDWIPLDRLEKIVWEELVPEIEHQLFLDVYSLSAMSFVDMSHQRTFDSMNQVH